MNKNCTADESILPNPQAMKKRLVREENKTVLPKMDIKF